MKGGLGAVLGGGDGWAHSAGALLLLGAGLAFVLMGTSDLTAYVSGPSKRSCEDYLREPRRARWVSLTGCRLELPGAASRRFAGWLPISSDGGAVGERNLELFVPLGVLGTAPSDVSPVLVATSDPKLLRLVDEWFKQPDEASADAFVEAHAAELEAVLAPAVLEGYVEPVASMGSRSARAVLALEDAVILRQNVTPTGGKGLCSVLLGLALMTWALLPLVRRVLLWRETGTPSDQTPPPAP